MVSVATVHQKGALPCRCFSLTGTSGVASSQPSSHSSEPVCSHLRDAPWMVAPWASRTEGSSEQTEAWSNEGLGVCLARGWRWRREEARVSSVRPHQHCLVSTLYEKYLQSGTHQHISAQHLGAGEEQVGWLAAVHRDVASDGTLRIRISTSPGPHRDLPQPRAISSIFQQSHDLWRAHMEGSMPVGEEQ